MPPFLAPYYEDAFKIVGTDFILQEQQNKDNVSHFSYNSSDQRANLSLQSIDCERDRCQVLYQNAAQYFNKLISERSGRFTRATPTEFAVQWQTGLAIDYALVAKLPNSVLISSYNERLDRHVDAAAFLTELKVAVDHQRYDQIPKGDLVTAGIWSGPIHEHARTLLKKGKRNEAVEVLKLVIASAPSNYEAHGELLQNASDPAVARASAMVIYDNAEDELLIEKAARYLGKAIPEFSALPTLRDDGKGLHVVLIALPPCNLTLIQEAARLYQDAIDIPVNIRRFAESLDYGNPARIPDQRNIQRSIIEKRGPTISFTGWDIERYKTELMQALAPSDALSRFTLESYIAKLNSQPGQYDAGPLFKLFATTLARYRAQDSRAIYVGVTGLDIFSGDTNYIFSTGLVQQGWTSSILSYHRMSSKIAGDRSESRKRLAARLAKQLVPPTLNALGIPRPTDPTDAYSYADSVQRVDEKTLSLSPPTKEALDKLR